MRVSLVNVIRREPNRALAMVTRKLIISNTSYSDAGSDYSCRATNIAITGQDSERFALFVQGEFYT